jgi:hypothetical protein
VGRRRWTDEDIEKLRRLARTMPTAQIAAELERGISATIMKAHELGISLRLKPEADRRRSHRGRKLLNLANQVQQTRQSSQLQQPPQHQQS